MGQIVLQAAGTFAGNLIAPGIGGAIGGILGGGIGALLFQEDLPTVRNVQQPLSDLRVTGTEYGQPIPYLIGSHLMAGQLWWNTDRRMITTTTSTTTGGGGKGGGGSPQQTTETTTRTYDMDVLYGLTNHVIDGGVCRIFDNGKLIATFDVNASAASLAASASAETWDRLTIYKGLDSDMPDPTYEAAIVAEGKRPTAYRGRGTVFIQGLKLGQSGSLRNITFEVVADGDDNEDCVTDEVCTWDPVLKSPLMSFENGNLEAVSLGTGNFQGAQSTNFRNPADGRGYYVEFEVMEMRAFDDVYVGVCTSNEVPPPGLSPDLEGFNPGGDYFIMFRGGGSIYADGAFIGGQANLTNAGHPTGLWPWLPPVTVDCVFLGGTHYTVGLAWMPNGDFWLRMPDGSWVGAGDPESLSGPTGHSEGLAADSKVFACYVTDNAPADNYRVKIKPRSAVFEHGLPAGFYEFGGDGLEHCMTTVEKFCVSVEEAQRRLFLHAGLSESQFDVSALAAITRDVCCLPISSIAPRRKATELMMSVFYYDLVVADKIRCVPRGSSSAASIAYKDLAAAEGRSDMDSLTLQLGNDLELPAQIAFTYINIDNDYQSDTKYSDRLISSAAGTVNAVSLPIGLHPSDAKQVADVMLLDQTIALLKTEISLLGKYARLEPTDPVLITARDGSVFRMRLIKKTDSYPLLKFDAVLDDVSILSSQGITTADFASQTEVAAAVSTLMRLLDMPILQDADDNAGFYVVVKGSGTPYPGSAVFDGADDVSYAQRLSIHELGVFGSCTTALGDWTGLRVFDNVSTVTLDVGDATLSSSTRDAVLANQTVNAFLIGDEMIQAVTATLVSPGVYTLSQLLRGGRGTEWAMVGHLAGERCVLLRAFGMRRIALTNSQLGVSRFYKGVTLGRPESSGTGRAFTCNSIGQKPFSPVDLRTVRDASNNITGTFKRRTRLSTRLVGALGISVPLGEATEAYQIDAFADDTYATVVRTISVSTPAFAYSAAQQTADGLTPGDPVAFHIHQISAAVGRGYELEIAA